MPLIIVIRGAEPGLGVGETLAQLRETVRIWASQPYGRHLSSDTVRLR
jgi:hypothetical protein